MGAVSMFMDLYVFKGQIWRKEEKEYEEEEPEEEERGRRETDWIIFNDGYNYSWVIRWQIYSSSSKDDYSWCEFLSFLKRWMNMKKMSEEEEDGDDEDGHEDEGLKLIKKTSQGPKLIVV